MKFFAIAAKDDPLLAVARRLSSVRGLRGPRFREAEVARGGLRRSCKFADLCGLAACLYFQAGGEVAIDVVICCRTGETHETDRLLIAFAAPSAPNDGIGDLTVR